MLPTMQIGDHAVTRLIAGSNPFTGKSHMTPEMDADISATFSDVKNELSCSSIIESKENPTFFNKESARSGN